VLTVTVLDALQAAATAAVLRLMRAADPRALDARLPGPDGRLDGLTAATSILVNGLLSISLGGPFWQGWSEWTTSNVLGVAIALPTLLILFDRRHREASGSARWSRCWSWRWCWPPP
jgi:hypothetical protein